MAFLLFLFILFSLTSASTGVVPLPVDIPKTQSDLIPIPVSSHNFFVDTKDISKPSGLTALPVDSRTFYVGTKDMTKHSGLTSIPVNSRTFYVPTKDMPKPSGFTAVPVDSRTFDVETEHEIHPDNVTYCSVYFKKEDLKKRMTLCPLFTPQTSELKPNSEEMRKVISSICHSKTANTESDFKFCTSSYQDMAKEVTVKLGKNNKVLSSDDVKMKSSNVTRFEKIAAYGKAVVCHRTEPSPHVSFYCHQIRNSSVYALSLTSAAENHQQIQRLAMMLAVCHDDTTAWNPSRLAFQLLKVKPGAKVCHLLPSYDLVWVALA